MLALSENLNTIAALGTFVVITATAVAAVVQLRHMRANNQLAAILALYHEFGDKDLQEAFRFVQQYLPQRMTDQNFRQELAARGFIDNRQHLEIEVLNWFEQMGTLLKHDVVDSAIFLDIFGRLTSVYWDLLEPTLAIIRRRRGESQYQNFEYLAIRARKWLAQHPHGTMPREVQRLGLADPWLAADANLMK
jgi:hypothetical protein